MKFAIIAAGAALVGATAAFADHDDAHKNGAHHAGAHKPAQDWEAMVEQHFKDVDENADGAITEGEMLAYAAAKAKREFDAASGGDGKVTLDEAKAHHKAKHDAMMKERGAEKL